MSKDEREDSGRYAETVTVEAVFEVFERVEGPIVISGDIAEAPDRSRETVRGKFQILEEQARIAS